MNITILECILTFILYIEKGLITIITLGYTNKAVIIELKESFLTVQKYVQ